MKTTIEQLTKNKILGVCGAGLYLTDQYILKVKAGDIGDQYYDEVFDLIQSSDNGYRLIAGTTEVEYEVDEDIDVEIYKRMGSLM